MPQGKTSLDEIASRMTIAEWKILHFKGLYFSLLYFLQQSLNCLTSETQSDRELKVKELYLLPCIIYLKVKWLT